MEAMFTSPATLPIIRASVGVSESAGKYLQEMKMTQMNRREFVAAVACAACMCGLGGAGELLADTPASGTVLDVGLKSDYKADGITDTWMKPPNKVAVIRHAGRIYAITTVCTHRGAIINAENNSTFECPRHHATYDIEGNVTHGPAKVALVHYAISVNADGHIIVDKTKSFTATQWDDPDSFVKVD
jgi:nitrite reductase/ring-hydroxylating ferredoxin subunit